MKWLIMKYPLAVYFGLAYAFSWAMVALIPVSFVFALLALFGPALAAIIVTAATDGRRGVVEQLRQLTIWRVGVVAYALVIGVPLVIAVTAQVVHSIVFGGAIGITAGTSIPLTVMLAVLVVGEEIGWRGFALPRLVARFGGLGASLVLGTLWAGWHLANATIPGLESYWYGFPAFLCFVVGQTIFFTWLWNRTGGSLLLMWILHAMVNVSGSVFFVGDQVQQWWLSGAGYALVAVILVVLYGPDLAGRTAQSLAPRPSV
jgi:membrane protease YdiL (CAAX protease family)